MTDQKKRKAAIDTIARRAIFDAAHEEAPEQAQHLEIDDDAFDAVCKRVDQIAASLNPGDEQYRAALDHLAPQPTEASA